MGHAPIASGARPPTRYVEGDNRQAATPMNERAARMDKAGVAHDPGLIVVLLWIGGLKAVPVSEADGIVPFITNSPTMSFFYTDPGNYKAQQGNPEGILVPENRSWHEKKAT